jgi:hypothetical protein
MDVNRNFVEDVLKASDPSTLPVSRGMAVGSAVLSVIPGGGEASAAERLAVNAIKGRTFGGLARRLATKLYDIIPYWRKAAGFEKHHGVLNVWAKANIPGYSKGAAPSIVLTPAQHNATRIAFNAWKTEMGYAGGKVPWTQLSAREAHDLAYRLMNAAGIPAPVQADYFRAFHLYIYGF